MVFGALFLGLNLNAEQYRDGICGGTFETQTDRNCWGVVYNTGHPSTSAGMFQSAARAYPPSLWYGYCGDYTPSTFNASGALYQFISPQLEANATRIEVSYDLNITSDDTTGVEHDWLLVLLLFYNSDGTPGSQITIDQHSNKERNPQGLFTYTRISNRSYGPLSRPCRPSLRPHVF